MQVRGKFSEVYMHLYRFTTWTDELKINVPEGEHLTAPP